MKKISFLLFSVLLTVTTYAQKNATDGIFFEISGNGLKTPSYILGSNHEVNGEFVHQIPQFDLIYNKVGQTCFETDLKGDTDQTTAAANNAAADLQKQQQDASAILLLPADSTYEKIIGKDKAAEINEVMTNMFPNYVPNMRPAYAATILQAVMQSRQLSLTGFGGPFLSIDYYVHEQSVRDKKHIAALEPRSLQDSIIARMHSKNKIGDNSMKDQMMNLYVMCMTADARINSSLHNRMLYTRGLGAQSIKYLTASSDEIKAKTKSLIPDYNTDGSTNMMAVKERNALWMKKIPELMKKESTLFVVGLAHLYPYRDAKGLLADLRKKGYKIRQLDNPQAQLQLHVEDAEARENVFLVRMKNDEKDGTLISQMLFDEQNNATFSGVVNSQFNQNYFFIGQKEFACILQKGKQLKADIIKENGKYEVVYSGDPEVVKASNAFYQYRQAYSYPKYFARTDTDPAAKTTYEEKLKSLDKSFADINAMAANVENEEIRNLLLLDNRCEYLRFRLSVMRSEMNKQGIDITKNAEYQKYLDMIDVENSHYESYGLITNYIKGKIPQDAREKGLSNYGIEAMRAIQTYVKDRNTRLQLQGTIAQEVLTEENKDIDTFWNAFKEFGDADVVKALESKVNALKTTESGMKAPVCEFNDIDGKTHKSSDFEGKVLYIDFWATWCGPCKQEIPHMEKLYEHYKDNPKIAIISISIDTNVAAWKKMVTNDKPAWPQFIAEGVQNVKMSNDWGITAIPRFIILNADGTINSANAVRPSSPDIIKVLDTIIAEQK